MQTKDNTKTLLTVKVDKKIKKAAQKVAEEIGIPLGTFLNMTLKQLVRDKEIRFEGLYTPNKKTIQAIIQGEKDFKDGKLGQPLSLDELRKKWKMI